MVQEQEDPVLSQEDEQTELGAQHELRNQDVLVDGGKSRQ